MLDSETRVPPAAPEGPPAGPPRGFFSRPLALPACAAAAFAVAQLALVVPGSGLGWDEVVYVSQVGGDAPPAYFSAPRARGISYLVAPVAALTGSTTAIRVYLALLSSAALFGALAVWRTLLPARVLAAAGALFAGLWITLFYGPQVMPNLWCAFGALAAAGCFVRAVTRTSGSRVVTRTSYPSVVSRTSGRSPVSLTSGRSAGRALRHRWRTGATGALLGLGAAVGAVTLLRPPDGAWLAAAPIALTLLVPRWRSPAVVGAVLAGLLAGAAPWVAEAYEAHGGLAARLHRGSDIQGGTGWRMTVDDQARALAGRTLCRPCDVPWKSPLTAVWWFALPVLTAGGIYAARRARRAAPAVAATVTAAVLAVPYLFLIGYGAPRFLLPTYALLALPVAECLVFLFAFCRTGVRPAALRYAAVGALVAGLAGHLVVQGAVLQRVTSTKGALTRHYEEIASGLHAMGVRPPCVISGHQAIPIAYFAGCSSRQTSGQDTSTTPAALRASAARMPVAVIVTEHGSPPAFARDWPSRALPETEVWSAYRAYLAPAVRAAGAG